MGLNGAPSLTPIRVVVASPGDVAAERDRLAAAIEELNAEFEDSGVILLLYRWETDAHPGFHVLGPQGQVDKALKIEHCDIFVGIFWKRFGTPVPDAGSGTEHEFKIAYERWKASGRPHIMLYFRNKPFFPSAEEIEQMRRVLAFRDALKKEALFCEFTKEEEFERAVRIHLRRAVNSILSPPVVPPGVPHPPAVIAQATYPYDYTVPVGREMFFGRAAERDEILAGVKNGKSFALIGGTRIGKTSLLYEIKRTLFEDVPTTSACVAGPVFLSAHQFETLNQAAIYRQVMLDFEKEVCTVHFPHIRLADSPLFKSDLTDGDAFSKFKDTLKGVVRVLGQRFRIVILLDEVDVLQQYPWAMTFFNNIRSLTQSDDPDLKSISWVIAGTLAIDSLYKVAGSPFLNVISAALRLGPLSLDEAHQLIQKPTGGRVPQEVANAIYSESGGHPFLVQYLMAKCLEFGRPDPAALTCDQVSQAVERFSAKRRDFDFWTSRFNATDDAVYALVAQKFREVSKAEVLRRIPDPPAVNHSLTLLAHCGIIRETARNRFCYSGEMFRRWFSENRVPLESASAPSSD